MSGVGVGVGSVFVYVCVSVCVYVFGKKMTMSLLKMQQKLSNGCFGWWDKEKDRQYTG